MKYYQVNQYHTVPCWNAKHAKCSGSGSYWTSLVYFQAFSFFLPFFPPFFPSFSLSFLYGPVLPRLPSNLLMTLTFWSFLILLPHPQCWDYRPESPRPVNTVLRINPRASCQPLLRFLNAPLIFSHETKVKAVAMSTTLIIVRVMVTV